MMASFMSYFGAGRKDPKQTARDAIVGLRQQLQMIEKKEEYLQKKIEEETKKARANAVSNKAGASFRHLPPPIPSNDLAAYPGCSLSWSGFGLQTNGTLLMNILFSIIYLFLNLLLQR